ncbi:MAG: chromosomal replication initiator protein DnaA [Phycisphaerae bacterium]|nr:chromosomal replication initiator protein DnaA [Phycisphaerae bacterium]
MALLHDTATEHVTSDLQAAVGPERWRVWFDGSTDIRVESDRVTVGVANLFISDYLKSHFTKHLAAAVRARVGRDLPITWHVQPDLFQKRRAANLADEAEAMDQLPDSAGQETKPAPSSPPAAPRFTLDNFVVGPCNQMAYAAARSAITAPGKDFHPLFIHGGCGLGKTHLLYAILHALETRSRLRVVCLSAEQFTNRYLAGVRTGRLDAFRHHYRHLDVLAIDDVHFLGGKPATQEEFLHTFDEFEGSGRLIILASDAHPTEIQAVQHRLISRWVSGLVVHLSAPDVQTRRHILHTKAREMGRTLSDDVVHLVADRVQGSVRDLEGALTRILAYAALLKQPVTPMLARQAVEGFIVTRRPRAGVREIETTVADFFGVTIEDIHSSRKARLISLARQVTMVLAREMTDLSLAEIARLLGGKNHTTVLAACRKWRRLLQEGTEIAWTDKSDRRALSAEALLAHLRERIRR